MRKEVRRSVFLGRINGLNYIEHPNQRSVRLASFRRGASGVPCNIQTDEIDY